MNKTDNVQTVLQGLIDYVPTLATIIVVLAAIVGIAMAGHALVRMYEATTKGEGFSYRWVLALVVGSLMTMMAVVIAGISFFFSTT